MLMNEQICVSQLIIMMIKLIAGTALVLAEKVMINIIIVLMMLLNHLDYCYYLGKRIYQDDQIMEYLSYSMHFLEQFILITKND